MLRRVQSLPNLVTFDIYATLYPVFINLPSGLLIIKPNVIRGIQGTCQAKDIDRPWFP